MPQGSPSRAVERGFLALFLLGLVLRLLALPLPGMMDVKAWKAWSTHAVERGVAKVYGPPDAEMLRLARANGGLSTLLTMELPRSSFAYRGEEYIVDYPPASVLLLWGVGKLYSVLDPGEVRRQLFNLLLNLLPLVGSLAIAWILKRSAPGQLGWWRALAFWCNPALLLASVLGYQDPVFAAVGLMSVLALMRGEQVLAAAFVVGTGLLKPQGILLVPTLLAVVLAESRVRTWIRPLLAGGAAAALILSPWWTAGHLISALEGCFRPPPETTLSAQGLNVWWIAGYVVQWKAEGAWPLARILFRDEFASLAGWPVGTISRLLLAVGTLANIYLLLRAPDRDRLRIPLSVILQTHIYFLFSLSVHENHAFLTVVLAPLLLGACDRGRRYLAWTSGLLLANLFLFEGLGRGIIRDRSISRLRHLIGIDMTVIVAGLHVALVIALLIWLARRARHV